MIYITNENGVFLFIDNNGKKQELVDLMDSSENHSRITFACGGNDGQNHYPMLEDTFKYLNTMRDGSPATMMRLTVLLCILNELIQKPRNYQFLHIGDWSAFNENTAAAACPPPSDKIPLANVFSLHILNISLGYV